MGSGAVAAAVIDVGAVGVEVETVTISAAGTGATVPVEFAESAVIIELGVELGTVTLGEDVDMTQFDGKTN